MKNRLFSVLLGLALGTLFCGCAVLNNVRMDNPVTLGRELMDLKAARDAGAISRDEYEDLRQQLIDDRLASGNCDEDEDADEQDEK